MLAPRDTSAFASNCVVIEASRCSPMPNAVRRGHRRTDPETVKEVLVTIRELAEDGMTCIIVTHEMAFAREVADQIYQIAEIELALSVVDDVAHRLRRTAIGLPPIARYQLCPSAR